MKISIFRRLRDGVRSPFYSYKFRLPGGPQVLQRTQFTDEMFANLGGAKAARAAVRRQALADIRQRAEATTADANARADFRLRASHSTTAELFAAQILIFPGLMHEESARGARFQLRNLLAKARPGQPLISPDGTGHGIPLTELTPKLVQDYADAVLRAATAERAGQRRILQMKRTANSTHRMACVLFGRKMRDRYAAHGVQLPPNIDDFTKAQPFDLGKIADHYNPPTDTILRATLADLEAVQREKNPNLYKAVWLALGWGLRKSEIFGCRWSDLELRDGRRIYKCTQTIVARQMRDLPKNDDPNAGVPEANDAWSHLAPFAPDPVARPALRGEDYILTGPTKSHRTEYVARDVGLWMRAMGWGTQKTLHAWRAYAICQIVKQTKNLKTASKWARHASVLVTERSYGHFLELDIDNVPLRIPEPPAPFVPAVVSSPVSQTAEPAQVLPPQSTTA